MTGLTTTLAPLVSTHTPELSINRIITITDNGVAVGIQPVD